MYDCQNISSLLLLIYPVKLQTSVKDNVLLTVILESAQNIGRNYRSNYQPGSSYVGRSVW